MKYGGIGAAMVVCATLLLSFMQSGVKRKDLIVSTVDKGTIEVSVSASGRVVPAFEEIINSPIHSRILEVYGKGGDSVEVGTPILKLDLQSTQTAYNKLLDEEQMRRYQLEQLRINNETQLSNMAMNIKVSATWTASVRALPTRCAKPSWPTIVASWNWNNCANNTKTSRR